MRVINNPSHNFKLRLIQYKNLKRHLGKKKKFTFKWVVAHSSSFVGIRKTGLKPFNFIRRLPHNISLEVFVDRL